MRRHITTALLVLAIIVGCIVCDTIDSRQEPGRFADSIQCAS